MAEEILACQANALVVRTGQPLHKALQAIAETKAGRQLQELASGEHHAERAASWQASLLWTRAEERHYSWLASYMRWLEGKVGRTEYHAFLKEELASLSG